MRSWLPYSIILSVTSVAQLALPGAPEEKSIEVLNENVGVAGRPALRYDFADGTTGGGGQAGGGHETNEGGGHPQ